MKKDLLLASILILTACDAPNRVSSADSSKMADSVKMIDSGTLTKKTDSSTKDVSDWNYSDDTDKMTSKVIYYASVVANNELTLSAPYDGDNHATLSIRKKEGKQDVYLKIDKGQFMAGVEGETIRIRFDKNTPVSFDCTGSSDDDPTLLFFSEPSRFIAKAKKAHKMIIEATVYQDGNQQMEFNIANLNWKH